MELVIHALTGAALMLALFHPTCCSPIFWALIIYGLIMGSIPDTLGWFLWKVNPKKYSRWGTSYQWFHHTRNGFLLSMILIAPFPHIVGDYFIHTPVLPAPGENSFCDEILVQSPIKLTRRSILWLLGEIAMFFLFIILIGVYIFL